MENNRIYRFVNSASGLDRKYFIAIIATMTGADIIALRAKFKLTQAELADELGVKQNTVSDWERDKKSPRQTNLFEIGQLKLRLRKPRRNGRA